MLKIENLTKVFNRGSINEKKAIDKLNLTLEAGEFVTVIGSNGAGKSTLMNCIAGVYPVDGGQIILDNQNLTKLKEHKRAKKIGRVFQDPLKGTASDMTIEENLAIALAKQKSKGLQPGISKMEREEIKSRLETLNMGLENRLKEKVKFLSGGQRQAMTLLMAILGQPSLLLLDEHTAALDPSIARTVLSLTDNFASSPGLITMMITHNMSAALEHGTRTIVMREGRIDLDISGSEREDCTVDKLISQFDIDNDRMLI